MPQVTGTATQAGARFTIGGASAQFYDGDTSTEVTTSAPSHFTPDAARAFAEDLENCADIAWQLGSGLQYYGIVEAFVAVCEDNGWTVEKQTDGDRITAARIAEGVEL